VGLIEEINRFQDRPLLVLGDLILDIYIKGAVERISPEAPIPILQHHTTHQALGGAGNVAANLQGLGANTSLVSAVGLDTEGDYLETMLDLEGIHHQIFKFNGRVTTSKSRVIAGNQQLLRIDHERIAELNEHELQNVLSYLSQLIDTKNFEAIILEDYNKGFLTKDLIHSVLALAQSKRIPTIVDPKNKNFFEYRGCTLFKPNFKECAAQVPFPIEPTAASLRQADHYLRSKLDYKYLLVTLAEHGAYIHDGSQDLLVPTQIKQIADVSGAGDTVTAIATFGIIQSLSLAEILNLANLAAGHVCGIPGVHAITKPELISLINNL
jgi:D-glycero-beta-D-manno-heptose-7-phosphate kinase